MQKHSAAQQSECAHCYTGDDGLIGVKLEGPLGNTDALENSADPEP